MNEDEYGSLDKAIRETNRDVRERSEDTQGGYILRIERIAEFPDLSADGIETVRCVTLEQFNEILDHIHEKLSENPSFVEFP